MGFLLAIIQLQKVHLETQNNKYKIWEDNDEECIQCFDCSY